jgi:hypothetical protein
MPRRELFKLEQIAYHRNGITGCGFFVVTFTDRTDRPHQPMIAVVFNTDYADDGCLTAVLNREKTSAGAIASFGNAYRGDYYDGWLREQIKTYEESRS